MVLYMASTPYHLSFFLAFLLAVLNGMQDQRQGIHLVKWNIMYLDICAITHKSFFSRNLPYRITWFIKCPWWPNQIHFRVALTISLVVIFFWNWTKNAIKADAGVYLWPSARFFVHVILIFHFNAVYTLWPDYHRAPPRVYAHDGELAGRRS